jgi:hypothetical protein
MLTSFLLKVSNLYEEQLPRDKILDKNVLNMKIFQKRSELIEILILDMKIKCLQYFKDV